MRRRSGTTSYKTTSTCVLVLGLVLCLLAAGCNHPMFSKPTAAKPPAEKPDFSKLQPGKQCRVELAVLQKSGSPAYVAYTGTVSRVQGDEVTLVDATRESGNEYGTPVGSSTPLANRMFKNRGMADHEKVGTISIPLVDVSSVKPLDEMPKTSNASDLIGENQEVMGRDYNRFRSG